MYCKQELTKKLLFFTKGYPEQRVVDTAGPILLKKQVSTRRVYDFYREIF